VACRWRGVWSIENATKENKIKLCGDARLTSKTLAGVLIKKLPPRMPLGPSLTLIVGIPNLSIAHVCQKPTPAIREMASSVVNASRILDRSAFAKSEGAICAGLGQKLEVSTARGGLYTGQPTKVHISGMKWETAEISPGQTPVSIPGWGINGAIA
jgi:hypothetical protein